ncbi:MAG: hypothetical protein SPF32_07560 [Lactobacillus johnsonii]|nr:hypothetical protein [Lactobacillus johnsonii]MCI6882267.1 hypothetical protein [Lactobacillus johnsonii]MDY2874187.1 hypothetical protein [Lactobacillus johnsonii]MDY5611240.1 hypothetical protein [Lactobacillus johnsonii]
MSDKGTQATVYFHNQAGLNEWQRKYYDKIIITHKLETIEGNTTGYLITFFLNRKHLSVKPSYTDQLMDIVLDAKTIDYYHSGINTVRLF